MGDIRKSKVVELPDGTKKRVWVRGKSARSAARKLDEKIERAKAGAAVISPETTFEAWAEKWLETYKSQNTKQNRTYRSNLKNHVYPYIGHIPISKIKSYQLQDILNAQAGKSLSHISKIRNSLNQIFKRARKNGLIPENVAEDLELPEYTDGTHRSITDYERSHILRVAESHRSGLWVKMLLYSGMRPGESRALLWENIDLKAGRITIRSAVESGGNKIKAPKTEAGCRTVPITNKDFIKELSAAKRAAKSTYVFVQPTTGKRHTESSLRCIWTSFKRDLDIEMGATVYRNQIIQSVIAPDLTPYCLRHTYGTDLQRIGVPINVAKYFLGHTDIKLTANVYTHFSEENLTTAEKLISTWNTSRAKVKA